MRLARAFRAVAMGIGLAAVNVLAADLPLRAQSSVDFALSIEGDASCSPAAALQDAIEARVGGLVFTDDPRAARRIAIVASAEPEGEWRAAIAMRDARGEVVGEREVRAKGARCGVLDEALIVVITTMIGVADPSMRPPAPEPAPEPEPTATEPTPAPSAPERAPEPASAPLSLDMHLAVLARAEIGFLPGLAPGAAFLVGFDLGAVVLSLGGSVLPSAREDLGAGAYARFTSVAGEASLCLEAGHPLRASIDFCAGAQAGVIAARTTGLYAGASRVDPVVRALVAARLRAPFGEALGLLASLEAAAPLAFPRYFFIEAGGARRYYHSVELGIGAQIGIYWIFSS